MRHARASFLAGLLTLAVATLVAAGPQSARPAPASDSPEAKQARLALFREPKSALFPYSTLYAIPAGERQGQRVRGIAEWIMYRAQIPVPVYEGLAKQWNPVKFDPEAWCGSPRTPG